MYKFDNPDIDFNMWFHCNFTGFIIPRKCTDFNWKLFHGHVFTEVRLQKMKFSDGICKMCNSQVENIVHLLISCTGLKDIWKMVENILCIKVTNFEIIAGCLYDNVEGDVQNMIISITRFVIWKRRNIMKYDKKMLSIDDTNHWLKSEFKSHINVILKTEKVKKNTCLVNDLIKILNKL